MTDGLAVVPARDRRDQARQLAEQVTATIGRIVLGKDREIQLALACLLARGHLLIEDVPGVGKTLLARAIAIALGLEYRRIQFTSDLLPADIIGVSVFEQNEAAFRFHEGPLFAELVLADEINRATPKAQSALLEAMEEQQVTADGKTYDLHEPFFVIATQNPMHQIGTFPLPESQLDRFLMRISLGYPAAQLERQLLTGKDRRSMLNTLESSLSKQDIIEMQKTAHSVHVSEAILDYAQALVRFTREAPEIELGLSPRGTQDLIKAARCWALISGHSGVHPEDLKTVFPPVTGHRLRSRNNTSHSDPDIAAFVLESVPVP
ncbi:MAG: MoxR family ATPase [Gammaproteobacteria bacterium]|jgi:MoxR-like ATPase|nr:AAA family ATPase [Chromatiales bacterium]MCP4924774.1 MoxR family ATPase [Gammaproteobacteria bacterium]MDP7418529.1 MoxR family ATPase [Gammaproteobacteria bacterium]MDP7659906.1 MoxR family ATPase [Gammaproteobacteria bacterium]